MPVELNLWINLLLRDNLSRLWGPHNLVAISATSCSVTAAFLNMNSGPAPEQAPKLARPAGPQIRHPKSQAWQPPSFQNRKTRWTGTAPPAESPQDKHAPRHQTRSPGSAPKIGLQKQKDSWWQMQHSTRVRNKNYLFLPSSLGSTHAFFGCIFPHWGLAVFLLTITWLWVCLMQYSVLITCGPVLRGQTFLVTWPHQHILGAW